MQKNEVIERFEEFLDLKEPATAENSDIEEIYLSKAEFENFSASLNEAENIIGTEMEF